MPAPLLAAFALLAATRASAPAPLAPSLRELGPMLLGQYETNLKAKLGEPKSEEKAESGRLLYYSLAGEMDTFYVCTVTDDEDPKIAAIQLTGKPKPDFPGLGGVNLGDSKAKVLKEFGEPTETSKTPDGGEFVQYDNRNYSFIFREDKLNSIKIHWGDSVFPKATESKPDLAAFQSALVARDRAAILDWLCADFYLVTKDDGQVDFKSGAREELADEASLVARYLYGGKGSLRELLTPELAKTASVEDKEYGDHPTNWISKDGPLYKIVWNFEAGRWRVWEIHLAPEEEDRE